MASVPGDPRILQRGGVLDLDDVRKPKPAPQPTVWYYFIETYDDAPMPIYVPIFVMPDGQHKMAIDTAIAPLSFLSKQHCRDFGGVMGWIEVERAEQVDDAADSDDTTPDETPSDE